jgi:hypothetical protein
VTVFPSTSRLKLLAIPFLFASTAFVFSLSARAEKFANQFSEFELPPNWICQLEGAEWVCQSGDPSKKKEAIIVLAAKLKGDMDSIDQYYSHLKSVKTFTSAAGKPMKSEPKYTKTIKINEQAWVDSLHLESEIAGFYTRYLATVKEDIGILVTYSISKSKYQEYLPEFEAMVNTLKVFRKTGGINVSPPDTNMFANAGKKSVIQDEVIFPKSDLQGGVAEEEGTGRANKAKSDELKMYLLFGVAAAFGYFVLKKKKK